MKNYWKSLTLVLVGVFALSSCDDVPTPYPVPIHEGDATPTVIEPEGEGTQASPYNVAAARVVCDNLEQTTDNADKHLSPEVYVKGIISKIDEVDTSYGNSTFYISDDGSNKNEFEVYRGYYLNGEKFTSEDQIAVGDTVVISGQLLNFKGTYEFNQGSKIVSLNGSSSGEQEPETPVDPAGSGTETDPYNVTKVKALIAEGNAPTGEIYIKAIISQIRSLDVSKYTRAQYYISDNGGTSNQFYVYNGLYLGGANFTANDQIKKGDNVVICGKLTTYQGEYQVDQNSKIVELNGKKTDDTPQPQPTGTPEGEGTAASPWNVAAVTKAYADNNSFYDANTEYYVKGIVTNVVTFNSNYGSLSYYIADEANGTNTFYVYSGLGLEQTKFTSKNDLKAGDEVVVCGKFTVYNGTFEFQYNNYLVSLNGITDPGDLPETPDDPNTPAVGDNSIDFSAQGYENAQDFNDQSITVGDATLTFSKGTGSTTPKYYNTGTGMRLYGSNTLTITSSKAISKIVFTYDDRQDQSNRPFYATSSNTSFTPGSYDYDTQTWTGSANSVVATYTAQGGHVRIQTITITYAE